MSLVVVETQSVTPEQKWMLEAVTEKLLRENLQANKWKENVPEQKRRGDRLEDEGEKDERHISINIQQAGELKVICIYIMADTLLADVHSEIRV